MNSKNSSNEVIRQKETYRNGVSSQINHWLIPPCFALGKIVYVVFWVILLPEVKFGIGIDLRSTDLDIKL